MASLLSFPWKLGSVVSGGPVLHRSDVVSMARGLQPLGVGVSHFPGNRPVRGITPRGPTEALLSLGTVPVHRTPLVLGGDTATGPG